MASLKTDSPVSRRIARSFLHFLNSVEPSPGVDSEALDVAKDCLAEVFKIDQSPIDGQSNNDSLVDIFSSLGANVGCVDNNGGVSDAPTWSLGTIASEDSGSLDEGRTTKLHLPGKDELFGQFFGALEKIRYFRRMPDGNDDQAQLDRATLLFHNAVEEMQKAGCETFEMKILAETFKSQGNKAMQSKCYAEAIELYTFAIALCEDNAVYYCNRAAASTQIHRYGEAVQDCLKSIDINPNYSKAYSRLGFAYYCQGMYRDAIDKGYMKDKKMLSYVKKMWFLIEVIDLLAALQLDPNNDFVKENIRVAEQRLIAGRQRAGPGQSSTSTGQYSGGSRNNSAPTQFNINGGSLPSDISSMFMNLTGNAFPGQDFHSRPDGESEAGGAHDNDAEVRMGGNMNFNVVNQLPEELSGAFRSMMEMFPGAAAPNGSQQDNSNGRSTAS